MIEKFGSRYQRKMRIRAARSFNNLSSTILRRTTKLMKKVSEKLICELERISCLAHDEDQSNHSLCKELWSAVNGVHGYFMRWRNVVGM